MNEEKAKKVLQEQIDKYGQEYDEEGIEALEMAIKALEQQPCEDCVSRTKVAEILKNNESYFDEVWYCIDLINKVNDLPPVKPQRPQGNGTVIENVADVDCVSRQVILERFKYSGNVFEFVNNLPSVTPQQKATGSWIEKQIVDNEEVEIEQWQSARCSKCGKYHTTPYLYYFNDYDYCPNCGEKMEGEE